VSPLRRPFLLGYNTNGFAHHRLEDALEIMADIGYRAVALTPDVHHHPAGCRTLLERLGLTPVIETGARYVLDSRRKHFPALMTEGRERRIAYYRDCIELADELGARCVSLWSGAGTRDEHAALLDGLGHVLESASSYGIDIGLEPEPGMYIETLAQYDDLKRELPALRLTLDVGHVHCLESMRPEEAITKYAADLVNVHLDDHRRGVHEHLMFGEGEIEWPPVMAALADIGVPATVELSRHSANAVVAAQQAFDYLAFGR
jgi:L-ribulose-5-phosphate 3-epimerase